MTPVHAIVVPLPQSILIGVLLFALFHLQVKCTLNPLFVFTGADPVITQQVAGVRGSTTSSHACPEITTQNASV